MIGAVIGGGGGGYTPKNSNKTKNFQPMLHFWGGGGYHCGREEGGRGERKEGGREIGREGGKERGRRTSPNPVNPSLPPRKKAGSDQGR